jgi:large subunit ribosomal protein L19
MAGHQLKEDLEREQLKKDVPQFGIGDTVSVHQRIIEGSKERTQVFSGTVIARKGGGLSETFSLYRIAYGESMERVFLLHSPRISKIEVTRRGRVRRAKLYYLRGKKGKKAKVRERIGPTKEARKVEKKVVAEQPAEVADEPATEAGE